jgi:hypothetical protein
MKRAAPPVDLTPGTLAALNARLREIHQRRSVVIGQILEIEKAGTILPVDGRREESCD